MDAYGFVRNAPTASGQPYGRQDLWAYCCWVVLEMLSSGKVSKFSEEHCLGTAMKELRSQKQRCYTQKVFLISFNET